LRYAAFHDGAHFTTGLVPADGLQVIWPLVIGLTRAKYFLLTGQTLAAGQAKQYGAVNEVLPADQLLTEPYHHPTHYYYTRINFDQSLLI
jgi:enoyl-CoA hydratase/carnithine racemase